MNEITPGRYRHYKGNEYITDENGTDDEMLSYLAFNLVTSQPKKKRMLAS
jgi:hypothetical protein